MLGAPENCELMWVQKFGFREMGEERVNFILVYNLLFFFLKTSLFSDSVILSKYHRFRNFNLEAYVIGSVRGWRVYTPY